MRIYIMMRMMMMMMMMRMMRMMMLLLLMRMSTVLCLCRAINHWHRKCCVPDATANAGTSSESCQHFQMFKVRFLVTSKVPHRQ